MVREYSEKRLAKGWGIAIPLAVLMAAPFAYAFLDGPWAVAVMAGIVAIGVVSLAVTLRRDFWRQER